MERKGKGAVRRTKGGAKKNTKRDGNSDSRMYSEQEAFKKVSLDRTNEEKKY